MNEETSAPLLSVRHLEGPGFAPVSLEISAGAGVLLHCQEDDALTSFLDIISGLAPAHGGELEWFGENALGLSDAATLKLRRQVGYATGNAGLISNLKVWENILLPQLARGLASTDEEIERLEERLVAILGAAGYHEEWIHDNLRESPDRLTDFEKIACGLARCHLAGFRVLVGDSLFGAVDSVRAARLTALLDWLGGHQPDSGLLLLHQGNKPDGAFGLRIWEPIEIVSLEPR